MTRLINADALLDALPKDDTLLSMDVRRVILDQPEVATIPRDYHERCMKLAEAEKIKLAKALKQERQKAAHALEQLKAMETDLPHWDTYSEYNEGWTDACNRIMSIMEGDTGNDKG